MGYTPEQLRLLMKMSRPQMARALGITPMTLYRRETGRASWNLLEIEQIARMASEQANVGNVKATSIKATIR